MTFVELAKIVKSVTYTNKNLCNSGYGCDICGKWFIKDFVAFGVGKDVFYYTCYTCADIVNHLIAKETRELSMSLDIRISILEFRNSMREFTKKVAHG